MSTSKYAGLLEGLATDQPDCFESGDEAEEGPVMPPEDPSLLLGNFKADPIAVDNAASIAHPELDAKSAQKRFEGKTLDASGTDFSGRLRGTGERNGYRQRPEYSMAGAGEKETVEERFNRLQHEGLLGELEAANGSLGKSSGNDVRDTVEMTSQMKFLSSQLSQVKVDALTGAWTGGAPAAHQADLTKRLLSDIANVKASAPADEAATAAPASDTGSGSGVTYELYYRPEESKFAHSLKTGELDRRIAALEGVVGSSPLSRVAAELDKAEVSMSDAVNILAARLSSLAPETIASLDTSLTSVIEKADAVKEKESGVPPETARKVDDLLALGTKWDAISDAVPAVIDRLAQLKELHERGANFGQTLTQLEATQLELKTGLADEKSMLATLEASFKANASAIEANFSAMDKRIEALNKNIAKLG